MIGIILLLLGLVSIGIGAVLYIGQLYAAFFVIGGVLVIIGVFCHEFLEGLDDYTVHMVDNEELFKKMKDVNKSI